MMVMCRYSPLLASCTTPNIMIHAVQHYKYWTRTILNNNYCATSDSPWHTGTPGVPPSHRLVWYEAAVQITTTLLGELLGRFLQAKFFDTDVPWCWAQVRGCGDGVCSVCVQSMCVMYVCNNTCTPPVLYGCVCFTTLHTTTIPPLQIRHGWWSFAVHSLWMAAALYTNSRYVWALFCPRDYGAPRGVLWEYCERPPYKSVTLDWALLAPRNAEFS